MPLTPGTRLGPYEVTAQIGQGGMGEVYRATDTKLKRQVAIKVLPASVAGDAERLARFQREAEVLASLNHPNIAAIHGLEDADDTIALVLELVEGPTLADRIARGAIPVDEALPIAKQIAEALEAAHEQGIIHRDLKPANVKVRPDGTVKVLDFGLAKALEPTGAMSPEMSQAPTITTPAMTQAGMILGTAAYMSPEQAKGRTVDKRSDVWAFGAVLYEMLSGQRAFPGDDMSEVLAGVIKSEPDWDVLPLDAPPLLLMFLKQCLKKDSKQRVGDIRDVRLALEDAFETGVSQAAESVAVPQPVVWRQPLPVAAVTAVVVLLGAGFAAWSLWPAADPQPVNQFAYPVPDDQPFRNTGRNVMALAPDGRSFVYNTSDGLYLRTMGELEARFIAGTEDGSANPFFSPDGQSVAYFWSNELRRIAISGGAPVVIAEVANNLDGATWGPDGTILFGQGDGIYRVPATGGTPTLVIAAEDGEQLDGPQLLPDGDAVLFSVTTSGSWDDATIVVQSLSSGERTIVLEGGSDARYLPTGHLVYALGGGLLGMAFDADSLSVTGGAVPLAQGVMRAGTTARANYGVSDGGTFVYVSGSSFGGQERSLVWVNRQGDEEAVPAPPRAYVRPRISPDGTQVAVDSADEEQDIWIWDFARRTPTRLTFDPAEDSWPVWTPDGRRLIFASGREGGLNLFWRAVDGTGTIERLAEDSETQFFPFSISPDGQTLAVGAGSDPRTDLSVVRLDSGREVAPLLQTALSEENGEISPDGRWIAYTSNQGEGGQEEVYVRPFPDVEGGRWQISTGGGLEPLWAPSGRELFYRAVPYTQGRLMSVPVAVQSGDTFEFGSPSVVLEAPYYFRGAGRNYDVSPDGERFLMIKEGTTTEASGTRQIIVVQNWHEELRRLVPTN